MLTADTEEEVDYSGDDDQPGEAGTAPEEVGPHGDEEIYGDLYTEDGAGMGILPVEAAELKNRAEEQDEAITSLRERLERVLAERDSLKEERAVLVRNISCLFKTAQLEIERKDAEIKGLRARVATQQLPPPPPLLPGRG